MRLCRALLAIASLPVCAHAQRTSGALEGALDVGSAVLRQPGIPGSAVWTLGSQLAYTGERAVLRSNALAAVTPDARWTAQGVVSGSLFAPARLRHRWELSANANAFGLTGDPPTTSGQLVAREHLLFDTYGVYLGAGGGAIVHERRWRPAVLAQAGAYARLGASGRDILSTGAVLTDTRRERLLAQPAGGVLRSTEPVTYGDLFGYWQRERSRIDLLAGAGMRIGVRGAGGASPWLSASATYWLTERIGIVAAAGRALEDVVRGVPSDRYASLAIRLGMAGRSADSYAPSRRDPVLVDDGRPRVTVSRVGGAVDAERVVTIRVPRASNVEVTGDFTDWEPVALARDSASAVVWTLVRDITPGIHRIAVRVDGADWTAPANLPQVSDEFGGLVGLLAVP